MSLYCILTGCGRGVTFKVFLFLFCAYKNINPGTCDYFKDIKWLNENLFDKKNIIDCSTEEKQVTYICELSL